VTSSAASVGFFFYSTERDTERSYGGDPYIVRRVGGAKKNHMWALFHPTVLADLFHMIIWTKSFQDECSFVLQSNDVANNVRSFFFVNGEK
jgi:hypothetical protein